MLTEIAKQTFTAELITEGLWGARDLGKHESTMILYKDQDDRDFGKAHYFIEWDVETLETCEHIGLTFDGRKRLIDYDGVFSLPHQAIKLIRQAGFTVPRDMEG